MSRTAIAETAVVVTVAASIPALLWVPGLFLGIARLITLVG